MAEACGSRSKHTVGSTTPVGAVWVPLCFTESVPCASAIRAAALKFKPPNNFAYCCLLLPRSFRKSYAVRKLVGAVGIENNTKWNFKDLEEMPGNTKTLKKNSKESVGILIGPSMAPHFLRVRESPSSCFSQQSSIHGRRLRAQILAARMASRPLKLPNHTTLCADLE